MKQRRRIYYSAVQRSEIWNRWQAGEPMSSIERRFDRESSSVFSVISPTGGFVHRIGTAPSRPSLSLNERRFLDGSACAARAVDRAPLGTICIDRQPRSQPQWRSRPLPGCRVRSGRLGSGAASQALQAGLPPVLEADSIDWVAATMVAGTNSWLAYPTPHRVTFLTGLNRDFPKWRRKYWFQKCLGVKNAWPRAAQAAPFPRQQIQQPC